MIEILTRIFHWVKLLFHRVATWLGYVKSTDNGKAQLKEKEVSYEKTSNNPSQKG